MFLAIVMCLRKCYEYFADAVDAVRCLSRMAESRNVYDQIFPATEELIINDSITSLAAPSATSSRIPMLTTPEAALLVSALSRLAAEGAISSVAEQIFFWRGGIAKPAGGPLLSGRPQIYVSKKVLQEARPDECLEAHWHKALETIEEFEETAVFQMPSPADRGSLA